MIKLIVNADDFGLNDSVNDAILQSFSLGYITNTTLMVNMPGTEEAVKRGKEQGVWDKVGLHINLFEGEPLNPELCKYPELLNCDQVGGGYLTYWASGIRRFYLNPAIRREIYKEVELQIQKFLSFDPVCMHVDSHGHFHTNYSVWGICKELFLKYGFKSTRLSRNLIFNDNTLKRIYKTRYNADVKKRFEYSTDYFGQFRDYKAVSEMGQLHTMSLQGKNIELMCHPVYNNGMLENAGSIFFEDMLNEFSEIKLISY